MRIAASFVIERVENHDAGMANHEIVPGSSFTFPGFTCNGTYSAYFVMTTHSICSDNVARDHSLNALALRDVPSTGSTEVQQSLGLD